MTEPCGSIHPKQPDTTCALRDKTHGYHNDLRVPPTLWENVERVTAVREALEAKKKAARRGKLRSVLDPKKIREGKQEILDGDQQPEPDPAPHWGPIVRADDPETAHEAAERYQPQRDTAKARVLAYLQARINQWVDAPELTHPDVGGFAGTRRLRELRDPGGWPIETRPKPEAENTWQHRLVDRS